MSDRQACSRHLLPWQLGLLFLGALSLHVLPLILADYPYLDDYWRANIAGNDWVHYGRPLAGLLFALPGVGPGAVDVFPLLLLVAVAVTAYAMAQLARQWFITPTFGAAWVILPLWYQPFFLQNLSYQYDGASMALSLAACVWAILQGPERRAGLLWGGLLVAVGAALYQISVNVFAGLCYLAIVRQVVEGGSLGQVWRHALFRLAQMAGGCLLYYVICVRMIAVPRTAFMPLDGDWAGEVGRRLIEVARDVDLLLTPGVAVLLGALVSLAALGLAVELGRLWQREVTRGERLGLTLGLLLPIPAVLLCIAGFVVLFSNHERGVRMLMGLGPVMMLVMFLVHRLLARQFWLQMLALGLPLAWMLSVSFAYGRLLVMEKELNHAIASSVSQAIAGHPRLASAKGYQIHDMWNKQQWLPAAQGTWRAIPATECIVGVYAIFLPDMLVRQGIEHAETLQSSPDSTRAQVLAASPEPVVTNRFFDLHLIGSVVHILMKPPPQYATGPRPDIHCLR